jgi:Methyltransferase domain
MTERNVPFLLNAAPAKTDAWTDRMLWRLAGYFRRRRFSGFDRFLSGIESIVDFGGTTDIWVMLDRRNVVLLNIDEQQVPAGFVVMKGDARKTSFPDKSFDLAFSNSTIEHVGTWEEAGIRSRTMPGGQARVLPDAGAALLLRAPLFHAFRRLAGFPAQAVLVCALFHLLWHTVEAFARAGQGFSVPSAPAELLRDAATVP